MDPLPPPLAFVLLFFAGWVNRQQQAVIDYLLEQLIDGVLGRHIRRLEDLNGVLELVREDVDRPVALPGPHHHVEHPVSAGGGHRMRQPAVQHAIGVETHVWLQMDVDDPVQRAPPLDQVPEGR